MLIECTLVTSGKKVLINREMIACAMEIEEPPMTRFVMRAETVGGKPMIIEVKEPIDKVSKSLRRSGIFRRVVKVDGGEETQDAEQSAAAADSPADGEQE